MSYIKSVTKLVCLWKDCNFIHEVKPEFDDFVKHVSTHLPEVPIGKDDVNEEMYVCGWKDCDYTTKNDEELIRHVKFHAYHTRLKTIGAEFAKLKKLPECSSCPVMIPPFFEPHVCRWRKCKESFNCQELFFYHVYHTHAKEAKPNSEDRYICLWRDCNVDVSQKAKLYSHLHIHTGKKLLACPGCGYMFGDSRKFANHCQRQISIEDSKFQCSHCLCWLPTARLLQEHMRSHIQLYKCSFCELTCRAPAILATHIRYRHLDFKPFKCKLCSFRCKKKFDLSSHMTVHKKESFHCTRSKCKFFTTRKYLLVKHIEKAHEDINVQYACHLCEKTFTEGNRLTKHLSAAHDIQRPDGYTRFSFRLENDGFRRLQRTRLECLDLSDEEFERLNINHRIEEEAVDDPEKRKTTIAIEVFDESGNIVESDTVVEQSTIPSNATVIAVAD